jgi:hypothetical protein
LGRWHSSSSSDTGSRERQVWSCRQIMGQEWDQFPAPPGGRCPYTALTTRHGATARLPELDDFVASIHFSSNAHSPAFDDGDAKLSCHETRCDRQTGNTSADNSNVGMEGARIGALEIDDHGSSRTPCVVVGTGLGASSAPMLRPQKGFAHRTLPAPPDARSL